MLRIGSREEVEKAAVEDRVASESKRLMWRNIIVMIVVVVNEELKNEFDVRCSLFSLIGRFYSCKARGRFIPDRATYMHGHNITYATMLHGTAAGHRQAGH